MMTPPLYIGFFRVFALLLLDTPVSISVLLLNVYLPGIYLNLFGNSSDERFGYRNQFNSFGLVIVTFDSV